MLTYPRVLDMNANTDFSSRSSHHRLQQQHSSSVHHHHHHHHDNYRNHHHHNLPHSTNCTSPTSHQLMMSHELTNTTGHHLPAPTNQRSGGSCFSPRLAGGRAKLPPHITICAPDSADVTRLCYEELDNEVFHPPPTAPCTPRSLPSDEKHEVHSGRLYLIRHTGSGNSSPAQPSSPSKSPCKSPVTSFPFRPSSPLTSPSCSSSSSSSPPLPQSPLSSSPTCSSHGSPTRQSPSPTLRKTTVHVRVYRCNMEHFALITRDVIYTAKPVYVNVRRCRLIPGDNLGRFVLAGKLDSGELLEFETPDLECLETWLDAFHSTTPPGSPSRAVGGANSGGGASNNNTPPIPRSPALPTLAEMEEEN